jgi:membrane-associated phospholipid phosphatase
VTLAESLATLLGGVAVMVVVTGVVVIDRAQFRELRLNGRTRLREVAPYLAVLGLILAVNKVAREYGPELSWIVGWNITSTIFALEGGFVALVQSVARPGLTAYFSAMYLFGYVFLLVFPYLAYAALTDLRPLKEATVAYSLNYALGLACYILFISYGPRNLIPDLVEPLLYATYPQAQLVTSEVNANTNVFPSLHTSLSVAVGYLAWRTRDIYPLWTAIAIPDAVSITLATMYLGIHWGTDVVAGALLGWGSVVAAARIVDRFE